MPMAPRTETMNEPDELEELLSPTPTPASLTFRARVREQTARHLRKQVLRRRLAYFAVLVGCYVAGAETMWFARPAPKSRIIVETQFVERKPAELPQRPMSPHDLELA